jgi:hypothetical protein
MKKILLSLLFIIILTLPAAGQLFTYGVQVGANYSHYNLSEDNSILLVNKGSVGFHSGFFARYDFKSFYIGSDINYSSTLGGELDDNNSSFKVLSGSVNLPVMIGKRFYPGIRIYGGGMPTIYIKTNDSELLAYLENSPYAGSQIGASLERNDFIFFMIAGFEVELSKFIVGFRYEHPLDYFVTEDFSTGGAASGIYNDHYLSQVTFTLGYRFN